jgi:ribosomal protein S12 methylthiotransferase
LSRIVPPRPPLVHIVTLGCAKNLADTDLLAGQLLASGFRIAPVPDDADAIVVNTCAFLASSQKESVEAILELAALKEQRADGNPLRLVVAGCLSQRHGVPLLEEIPEIDLLVGPGEIHGIAPRLEKLIRSGPNGDGRIRLGGMDSVEERWEIRVVSGARHSAYVKISEGCDRSCTFCVIPRLRGGNRSRTRESIVSEVRTLAAGGVREVNLVAQELTAYGLDIYGRPALAELLRDLDRCEGIEWIRALYLYPSNWNEDLIAAFRDLPRVCRYIDMPIQHVAEGVLRRMKRPGGARTRRLLERLRTEIPGVALRTTLIAGFPGETDADFEELLSFVRDFRFDHLGAFAFSPEDGTPAAELDGQVPARLRKTRRSRILAAQREASLERNRARVGTRVRIMVDTLGPGGFPVGRHAQQAPEVDGVTRLRVAGDGGFAPGEMIDAVVTAAGVYDLVARPANRREIG